jgi:transposase
VKLVNEKHQYMRKPLRRYDATFKRDAVELLLTSGKPLKVLAVELGVCAVTLREWRDRQLANTEAFATEGKKVSAQQLAQELRRTQQELQAANRRNEILKKALGILSQEPRANDMP